MLDILRATGRVLWRHWPALLAWFLGATLVHQLLIEAAGLVGGHSATLGLLILPLAVLARLIGFVGMFLVIRDGLRALQAISPLPAAARERRADFMATLLASVLPFFAVYTAQKELNVDVIAYANRALEERLAQIGTADYEASSGDVVLNLSFNVWTILIIVLAVAGRLAWSRWGERMPKAVALVALYFEVVWVFFSLLLLMQAVDAGFEWLATRAFAGWVTDLRAWLAGQFVPLEWMLSGVEWLFEHAGRVILEPLAWLAVAGVVYGQAIASERLRVQARLSERMRAGVDRVPAAVRERVASLTTELRSRGALMGQALLLLWRSGPVMIASYLLLYAVAKAIEPVLGVALVRVIGPHEITFWFGVTTIISLIPMVIAEPIRVSIIAGTFDTSLRALRPADASWTGATPEGGPGLQGATAPQGVTGNLANAPSDSSGSMSSQNGPSASSGTMNGTMMS